MRAHAVLWLSLVSAILAPMVASAQPVPDYDFQWSTIGSVGNAPYSSSNPDDQIAIGHGRVDHVYRASRLEISSAQWMEFLNAFAPFDNSPLDQTGPLRWGAQRSQQLLNGHWIMGLAPLPNSGTWPIGGITWRDAARYCNWLHNNKEVSLAAISTGAYDTTTWGIDAQGHLTDALDRMPGARFFLPTIDEYLKAVHYDPNRYGPGQGGYWQFDTSSDTAPVGGPPGIGQSSADYRPDGSPEAGWRIPIGSYPNTLTPWGLLDSSGGGQEWLERFPTLPNASPRPLGGSYAGMLRSDQFQPDYIGFFSGDPPFTAASTTSFRVYSAIPTPGVAATLGVVLLIRTRRSR